jgi:hypothetical protein
VRGQQNKGPICTPEKRSTVPFNYKSVWVPLDGLDALAKTRWRETWYYVLITYMWNGHCGPSLISNLYCSCVPFSQFAYHLLFFILTVREYHSVECDGETGKNIRTEMNKKEEKAKWSCI